MNLGFSGEMLFLAFLALVLLGPRKLPEIMKQVGRFVAEIKRANSELQGKLSREIENLELAQPIKTIGSVTERINAASVAENPTKAMMAFINPAQGKDQPSGVSLIENANRIRNILARNEAVSVNAGVEEELPASSSVESAASTSSAERNVTVN